MKNVEIWPIPGALLLRCLQKLNVGDLTCSLNITEKSWLFISRKTVLWIRFDRFTKFYHQARLVRWVTNIKKIESRSSWKRLKRTLQFNFIWILSSFSFMWNFQFLIKLNIFVNSTNITGHIRKMFFLFIKITN